MKFKDPTTMTPEERLAAWEKYTAAGPDSLTREELAYSIALIARGDIAARAWKQLQKWLKQTT